MIYLITCNKCSLQYVGETVQRLNERFTGHRQGMKSPEKHGTCKILTGHFNKGSCKGAEYSVQILEKIDENGRTDRGAIDATQTAFRKQRELHWMLKLRTVYPYGLNDRIGDEYSTQEAKFAIATRFPALRRTRPRIARGTARKGHNILTPTKFLRDLDNLFSKSLHDALNYIRVSVSTMKKTHLKQLYDNVLDILTDQPNDFNLNHWYSAILDLIDSKLYKPKPTKAKKSPPTNICRVFYSSKAIERINLPKKLHDPCILRAIPSVAKKI